MSLSRTTGDNHKYAVHLTCRLGEKHIFFIDRKTMEFIVKIADQAEDTEAARFHDEPVHQAPYENPGVP